MNFQKKYKSLLVIIAVYSACFIPINLLFEAPKKQIVCGYVVEKIQHKGKLYIVIKDKNGFRKYAKSVELETYINTAIGDGECMRVYE